MIVVSLDPGLNNPAAAVWEDGVLKRASRVKIPGAWAELDLAERSRRVSSAVVEWVRGTYRTVDLLLVEWPQVYSRAKSKGDPNDLLPLAGICVGVACLLDCGTKKYLPAEWAGQVPKSTKGSPLDGARGRRVWGALSALEREGVVMSHDAIDAVGIGLHYFKRLVRRNYPGST